MPKEGMEYFANSDHDHYVIDDNETKISKMMTWIDSCCTQGKYTLHMRFNAIDKHGKLNIRLPEEDYVDENGDPHPPGGGGMPGTHFVALSKITQLDDFKEIPQFIQDYSYKECMDISYLKVSQSCDKMLPSDRMRLIFSGYDLSSSCFALYYSPLKEYNWSMGRLEEYNEHYKCLKDKKIPPASCHLYTIPFNFCQLIKANPAITDENNTAKKLSIRKLNLHNNMDKRIKKYIEKGWTDIQEVPPCLAVVNVPNKTLRMVEIAFAEW